MHLFQWMFSLAGRLCSEGKRFWLSKWDFCHMYLILGGRGTHVDFLRFIIVSGRHYLPSDARAFSLTSLWNVKLFMRLNDGFRLFKFLQSASWIWKIINDCIFVRKSGSGRVFSGFGIWPKYCAGIGKTINILTGSGIWLFPGKRDSPKVGHGMRDLCLRVCLECRKPSRPTGSSQWPKRINQASAIKWCLLSNQTPYGVSGY